MWINGLPELCGKRRLSTIVFRRSEFFFLFKYFTDVSAFLKLMEYFGVFHSQKRAPVASPASFGEHHRAPRYEIYVVSSR